MYICRHNIADILYFIIYFFLQRDDRDRVNRVGDWSEHVSSSGKKYYYNCKTEVSQWEKPREWLERERDRFKGRDRDRDSERSYSSSSSRSGTSKYILVLFRNKRISILLFD